MAYQELKQLSASASGVRGIIEYLMSEGSSFQTRTLELARYHPVVEVRRILIQELSNQDQETAVNVFIERLRSDSDVDIRRYCAGILEQYPPSPAIIEALTRALNDNIGHYPPVCEVAASTLHNIGTPEALAAFEAYVQRRSGT